MRNPTLLVLAAGIGSRYGKAKQLDGVTGNNNTILDYSLFDAWKCGFGKAVFVIRNELEDAFRKHFENRLRGKLQTEYVFQSLDDLPRGITVPPGRTKPWGTGHAVRAAARFIQEPFAVINADDFYGRGAFSTIAKFLKSKPKSDSSFCLVCYRLGNTLSRHGSVSRGICESDTDGKLTQITERTAITVSNKGTPSFADASGIAQAIDPNTPVSLNLWGLRQSFFPEVERLFTEFVSSRENLTETEFFLPSAIDRLIKEDRCSVSLLETDEKWFGMTYPEDRDIVAENLRTLVNRGTYPKSLWT